METKDLMSEDFWRNQGIEPVIIDPNDENPFAALVERIETAVNEINSRQSANQKEEMDSLD